MKFRTEIELPKSPTPILHKDRILMLGSCFTNNIGALLKNYKFNVRYNPLGISFNPVSIAKLISHYGIDGRSIHADDLWIQDGVYSHRDFHSENNAHSGSAYTTDLDRKLDAYCDYLLTCDWLFLTLGTAWIYRWLESDEAVANCHKKPSSKFSKELLDTATIVDHLDKALNRLVYINPKVKVVLTVSPVRHLKDGMVENNWSKSRLIDAIHMLRSEYEFIDYFPSYEIVMDDLRNYRFYDKDLLHPSSEAIDYIWSKFKDQYFMNETSALLPKIEQLVKAQNHRPMNPTSDSMVHFCKKNLALIAELRRKAPYLNVAEELNYFNALKQQYQQEKKNVE